MNGKLDRSKTAAEMLGSDSAARRLTRGIDDAAAMEAVHRAEIRRSEDCPALEACRELGNARVSCAKGGMMTGPAVCMPSVILAISRLQRG